MHVRGEKIRRAVSILAAAAVTGTLVTTLTSASATASQTVATTTTAIALRGSIAGAVKITSSGDTVTFVFTETNQGTVAVDEFLVFTKVVNTSVEVPECVFPGGVTGTPDGDTCEPSTLKPGQSTSMVLTTQVTGTVPGTAVSVQACTYNGNGGAPGPCKTVSAKIG
jgi:uncharacterized cupredoxin-like copper-binding protein